jgi:hypothetical protein
MDEIEELFPVPLLRARKLLDAGLVAALARQIHSAHTSKNARSTLLSHTEVVSPGANDLYRRECQKPGAVCLPASG